MHSRGGLTRKIWRPLGLRLGSALLLSVLLLLNSQMARADDDQRVLRAAAYQSPPAVFIDAQGNPAGFWPELLNHIAATEGWRIEWVATHWSAALAMLERHEIDILPDTIITEARQQRFNFSNEKVRVSWSRVYTRVGLEVESMLDLAGLRIGVMQGSGNYLEKGGIKEALDGFGLKATFVEKTEEGLILDDLALGLLDAGVVNKDTGSLRESSLNVQKSPVIFQPVDLRFAYPKGVPETDLLMRRIDERLRQMKHDPKSYYYELIERWLIGAPESEAVMPSWVVISFTVGALLLLILMVGTLFLQQGIRKRTQALSQAVDQSARSLADQVETEQRLQDIVDNIPSLIFVKGLDGRYLLLNERFQKLFHTEQRGLIGKTDYDVFPKAKSDHFAAQDQKVLQTNALYIDEDEVEDAEGIKTYLTKKFPLHDAQGEIYGICGIATDISQRKRTENLRIGQQVILEMICRGQDSLTDILHAIVEFAEQYTKNIRASILTLEGTQLRSSVAPHMPAEYNQLIDGLEIGSNVGSCGTAAYRKEQVVVEDVETDPLWAQFRGLSKRFGFRACWSEPILDSKGAVLGTFALYRDEVGAPSVPELQMIEAVASLASIAMERHRSELALESAAQEWLIAMDEMEDTVFLTDMQRRLIRANKSFYRAHEISPEEAYGKSVLEFVGPWHDQSTCKVCALMDSGKEGVVEMEEFDPNNSFGKAAQVKIKLIRDADKKPSGILVHVRDLTKDREEDERQRLSASVFENTSEGVVITDPRGKILDVNNAALSILGYSRDEVIGQNPRLWKSGVHDDTFYRKLWSTLIKEGHWRGEMWNRRKDGSVFPEWLSISQVRNERNETTHYVAVFTDISQLKKSQEQLDFLAHHDPLTHLPNRLLLNERLSQAIKHAERQQTQLAVIFIDLDRFKNINDSMGHGAGDELLCGVAQGLSKTVRQGDTVARIGGDEFVLLLEDVGDATNVAHMAEKIMKVLTEQVCVAGSNLRTTASLGISLYPQDGRDVATLLRNADAAMYRAKDEGRNTFEFYTEEMTRNAFERVLLENSMRLALEREQFVLYYQPQVNLVSREIVGVEALIRWQHPEWGLVSPIKFIPLAEECGLITDIGRWVMRTACKQGKVWYEAGLSFGQIAVNVAGAQLKNYSFAEEVKTILQETQIIPSQLALEITEGFIMQQAQFAVEQLEEIRALGVNLAIDDFGTGYSSLSYLKRLPIHKLKIDRSFIRDIPSDANDMAISNAVVALGRSLDLRVVAEGIETQEQEAFLRRIGCQEGQGYLYSHPLTAEEFEALLLETQSDVAVDVQRANPNSCKQ